MGCKRRILVKSPPSGGSEVKKPMPALKGLGLREEEMVIV